MLTAEKECFTAIRHSQMEMTKLSERRVKEEQHVKLERPIYERTRDRYVRLPFAFQTSSLQK